MADADKDQTHDEDIELLTDEERAALEAGEGEEIDGSASLTGEDSEDWVRNGWGTAQAENDGTIEDTDDDDPAPADPADPSPAAAPKEDAADATPPPVDMRQYDGQLTQLKEAEEALFDKYDDGDLTREELASKRAEITAQISEITSQRAIAQQHAKDEETRWTSAVRDYLTTYADLKGDKIVSAFDAEVRAVTANPHFAAKPFAKQLEIAHSRLLASAEDLGLTGVPAIKGARGAPRSENKPADPRGDDMRTPPKTLARLPASDMADTAGGKFASLQRIVDSGTPEEIEAALMQMSPEERDLFASTNG